MIHRISNAIGHIESVRSHAALSATDQIDLVLATVLLKDTLRWIVVFDKFVKAWTAYRNENSPETHWAERTVFKPLYDRYMDGERTASLYAHMEVAGE